MSEVKIEIGGRVFEVACQDGEEQYLQSAAALLNTEATTLVRQIGRLPESRMLLMAGLMLADKTAGLEERLRLANAELDQVRRAPKPVSERIEVPVVPDALKERLADFAARAESIAAMVEEKTGTKG